MSEVRIRIGADLGKELRAISRRAVQAGDLRLFRRVSALLALGQGQTLSQVATSLGVSPTSVSKWLRTLLVEGVGGLRVQWRGGRPSKLTKTQKRWLIDLVKSGPEAAGFPTGCWTACLIQHLIHREFGVAYNVQYVSDLLKQLGFSFQKARFVSDHLDETQRLAWMTLIWPEWRRRAEEAGGLLLFGDEASFAQWGSLGYTWAPRGEQPVVKTTGKRKGYKVFGLIEFFSGRLFYQGIEGKFNGDSYITFLKTVLAQTTEPLFLIQDGASYHRAAPVKEFFRAHADRLFVTQLPGYSPDYNPIEFLWRATKRQATHNRYFPAFEALVGSVKEALAAFATQPERVKALFGRYLDLLAQPSDRAAFIAA